MNSIRPVLEHSLDWGIRWAIYWELYRNEKTVEGEVTNNEAVRGFYPIRPDGTARRHMTISHRFRVGTERIEKTNVD
jgi:hypothetical protein